VVGLEHDHVAASELGLDIGWHVAEIGGDGESNSLGAEDKANRISGIVGNRERADGEVAD
jgi:hypothetical protein